MYDCGLEYVLTIYNLQATLKEHFQPGETQVLCKVQSADLLLVGILKILVKYRN